jgi:hypothetical protein
MKQIPKSNPKEDKNNHINNVNFKNYSNNNS